MSTPRISGARGLQDRNADTTSAGILPHRGKAEGSEKNRGIHSCTPKPSQTFGQHWYGGPKKKNSRKKKKRKKRKGGGGKKRKRGAQNASGMNLVCEGGGGVSDKRFETGERNGGRRTGLKENLFLSQGRAVRDAEDGVD